MKLKPLAKNDLINCQKRGYFDEHLTTLYSTSYGKPYIYEDNYLLYHDPLSKIIWLTLFKLDHCNYTSLDANEFFEILRKRYQPNEIVTTSPICLPSNLSNFHSDTVFADKDYQINLKHFDENLNGRRYKHLRYRIKNAEKRNYRIGLGNKLTIAHSHIVASHMAKTTCTTWDYQLYLRLGDYVSRFPSPRLFNVFEHDKLVGFDVADFLSNVMTIPMGFYLNYSSLADFILFKEILYGKAQGFEWLDIGWACSNSGLEAFKKKWTAIPRFPIYVQYYHKVDKKLGMLLDQIQENRNLQEHWRNLTEN